MSLALVPIAFVVIRAAGGGAAVTASGGGTRVKCRPDPGHVYLAVHALERRAAHPAGLMHVVLQDVRVGVHASTLTSWRCAGDDRPHLRCCALLGFAFGHGITGLRGIVNDYS
jgi:hypothetical protein